MKENKPLSNRDNKLLIKDYINNREWRKAIDFAKGKNLRDGLMYIYDKMARIEGIVPDHAGTDMEIIGYFGKATEYYELLDDEESINGLKALISLKSPIEKNKENYKKTNGLAIRCMIKSNIEEKLPEKLEEYKIYTDTLVRNPGKFKIFPN